MKGKVIRAGMILSVLVLVGIVYCVSSYFQCARSIPIELDYEGIHRYQVGGKQVTIETRSYSIAKGDNGLAKIVVNAGGVQTTLRSTFSNDMYTYIKPAWVSWQNLDDHWGKDLIIWKKDFSGPFTASEYISSRDGCLYRLKIPLESSWTF